MTATQIFATWMLPLGLGMSSCAAPTSDKSNKLTSTQVTGEAGKARQRTTKLKEETSTATHGVELSRSLRLEMIVKRLTRGRKWEGIDIPVYLVRDRIPNTWATEDGTIAVTSGMLILATSDDELAAALAHELAHIELNHLRKQRFRATFSDSLLTLANLGIGGMSAYAGIKGLKNPFRSSFLASTSNQRELLEFSQVPAGLLVGGGIKYFVVQRGNKKDEIQADKESIPILADAGYKPEAALTLWQKFTKTQGQKKKGSLTHPSDEERLRKLELEVKTHQEFNAKK